MIKRLFVAIGAIILTDMLAGTGLSFGDARALARIMLSRWL